MDKFAISCVTIDLKNTKKKPTKVVCAYGGGDGENVDIENCVFRTILPIRQKSLHAKRNGNRKKKKKNRRQHEDPIFPLTNRVQFPYCCFFFFILEIGILLASSSLLAKHRSVTGNDCRHATIV